MPKIQANHNTFFEITNAPTKTGRWLLIAASGKKLPLWPS
jgi:hypothetical protein